MALFGGIDKQKRKDRVAPGLYRMKYGHKACIRSCAVRLWTYDAETALARKADLDALSRAIGSRPRVYWESILEDFERAHTRKEWRAALKRHTPKIVPSPPSVLEAWLERTENTGGTPCTRG